MRRPTIDRIFLLVLVAALALGSASCAEAVRVPLAVPSVAVGGARPAHPQALQLIASFGDGLWGQEQERAEMTSIGAGLSLGDAVEATISTHRSTRAVRDQYDNAYTGEPTTVLRGKLRLRDFAGGRGAVGVHVAWAEASRLAGDVQDDRLSALDVALPVELSARSGPLPDHGVGVYFGPRLVLQSFRDRLASETTTGALVGGVAGLVLRGGHLSLTGELTVARRPDLRFRDVASATGVVALPTLELRAFLPIDG